MPLVAVAPQLDVTTPHFNRMVRLISRRATLYTEMVVADAIFHRSRKEGAAFDVTRFVGKDRDVVVQLAGNNPRTLEVATGILREDGFTRFNLNVGCPSERVQGGHFGCVLMKSPDLVAANVSAMAEAAQTRVSVKCRLGVDRDYDSDELLHRFVDTLDRTGALGHLVVHARKAWLNGLSAKDNRTVPPIQYDRVYRLKRAFPHVPMTINGEIRDWDVCKRLHLAHVEGVMLGRAAASNPFMFSTVDRDFFHDNGDDEDDDCGGKVQTREDVLDKYIEYVAGELADMPEEKTGLTSLLWPALNLYNGEALGKRFRRTIQDHFANSRDLLSSLQRGREMLN